MSYRIPIFILGGSDSKPGPVPADLEESRMLRGCKGAIALPVGHCLAQELIHRIRTTEVFDQPILVGPRRIYEGLVDCPIVDVEGNLADTLTALRNEIRQQSDLWCPVAFTTCDILPTPEEFRELLEASYFPNDQSCLWGQVVAAEPETMGASSWKPAYHLRADEGGESQTTYPGHLLIARPAAVRIRLMIHLLSLAYRHRNLSLLRRPLPMIVQGTGRLIAEDCKNLFRGQLPILSVSIPWHCVTGFLRYQRGRLSPQEFSHAVTKVLLHRDFHHREQPPVVFSTTSIRAFAEDIDTQDELEELTGQWRGSGPTYSE